MKKFALLGCLIFLTACIDVDDYGDYWQKTSLDPSLQGRWAKLSEDDESKTTGQEWSFTRKNDAYSVQSYTNGKVSEDDPLYPVKTLNLGRYHFIASGPDKGSILRYEVTGNTITWYVADPDKTWDFIERKYPDQDEIYRDDPDSSATAEENRDRPLRIAHFDDQAAAIIAAIPNNPIYWDPDTKTRKIQ